MSDLPPPGRALPPPVTSPSPRAPSTPDPSSPAPSAPAPSTPALTTPVPSSPDRSPLARSTAGRPRSSGGSSRVPGGPPPAATGPWDWDRIRDLAEWWYRPLLDPLGWKALAYLFVGAISGVAFLAVVIAAASVTFGLVFVGVGILLVGLVVALVDVLARAERAMAGWVGIEIPVRDLRPRGRFGWSGVADPERWREVGYLALNALIGPILFGVGTFAYSLVLQIVFDGGSFGGWSLFAFNVFAGLFAAALAAIALGAAPRLAVLVATLKAHITAWFLGPDRLAAAEERVSELSTQRRDILDAVASERRRIERNLHDGVQQQLVAIGLDLGMAEQQLARDPERAHELIVGARTKVQGSIGELRQLGRGLHPAILEDRGIDAALSAVVSNAAIPISVQVDPDLGLSTDVAETVYFIANEAIANVLKHAGARVASVHVTRVADDVRITVHDDGGGGADPSRGTGLAGIRARVHAVDGTLTVSSPAGGPTTIVAELPRHAGGRA